MKFKTAILILVSAALGLFAIQNQTNVTLQFLWYSFPITQFVLVLAIFLIGLIVGLLIAPKSKANSASHSMENSEAAQMNGAQNLSQEDQDFLSED
jgi:uncharacterized integral membrane protein